jgi:hypothetical protein
LVHDAEVCGRAECGSLTCVKGICACPEARCPEAAEILGNCVTEREDRQAYYDAAVETLGGECTEALQVDARAIVKAAFTRRQCETFLPGLGPVPDP